MIKGMLRKTCFIPSQETDHENGAKKEDNSMPNPSGMVGGIRVELMTSAMSTQRSKPLS